MIVFSKKSRESLWEWQLVWSRCWGIHPHSPLLTQWLKLRKSLLWATLTIIIRGPVGDVKRAVEAGVEAAKKIEVLSSKDKALFLSATVIPRPHENLEAITKTMRFSSAIEQFR
jgi:CTP synthase (UTP-ammonia lyase)